MLCVGDRIKSLARLTFHSSRELEGANNSRVGFLAIPQISSSCNNTSKPPQVTRVILHPIQSGDDLFALDNNLGGLKYVGNI